MMARNSIEERGTPSFLFFGLQRMRNGIFRSISCKDIPIGKFAPRANLLGFRFQFGRAFPQATFSCVRHDCARFLRKSHRLVRSPGGAD
jgi:hypothetical protein